MLPPVVMLRRATATASSSRRRLDCSSDSDRLRSASTGLLCTWARRGRLRCDWAATCIERCSLLSLTMRHRHTNDAVKMANSNL